MKVSLEWLNEYLDRPATADEVERLMTDQGLPIETRAPLAGGDEMLDVEVTSNRPDCLSHQGVAREVAAGSGRAFKPADTSLTAAAADGPVESLTSVANDRLDLCPLYTARIIRGVRIGPSPDWMVRRLKAVGLSSVSNVVDVTNYVLMEMGQPLHAFDLGRLAGRRIVVRVTRPGEEFVAIDRSRHKLGDQMLVIADAERPVAIAGVMGGLESEVGPATTDILLESAQFDPLSVRRTSRALKLASDSSYRFERGVDPVGVELASRRAAQLICQIAGGQLAQGVIRVGEQPAAPQPVAMRVERCRQLLGLGLSAERMAEVLARLGLSPRLDPAGKIIACLVPSFRLDLRREVDLIEEVARIHGLNEVPVREKIEIIARPMQASVAARRELAQVVVAHGYHETVTFSFVRPALGEPFVPAGEAPVLVEDERRKAEPMLRPSLLPSLLVTRKTNQDLGNTGVRLFETAAVWSRHGERIIERQRLALLADAPEAEQAVRDLRGAIEELLSRLAGEAEVTFKPAQAAAYAAAAEVSLSGTPIGTMGLLAPATQRLFELQAPVVAAELDLPALLAAYPPKRQVRELARYPAIERDLSVVVAETVPWEQVRAEVQAAQPGLLEDLRFLVTYRGKPIPQGQKSVSFRMLFRDPAGTLRHEQVDPQVSAVVERLKRTLGAELRA